MSCRHGNHYDGCDICDEVDASFEAGRRSALAEQPAQQEPVGIVKDLFTNAAWDKLDVVGSTKVYLDFPPAQQEPFGYFKAEPFGWTDCAETDESAVALYTTPKAQPAREPLTLREIGIVCGKFTDEVVKVVRQTEAAHNIKENQL